MAPSSSGDCSPRRPRSGSSPPEIPSHPRRRYRCRCRSRCRPPPSFPPWVSTTEPTRRTDSRRRRLRCSRFRRRRLRWRNRSTTRRDDSEPWVFELQTRTSDSSRCRSGRPRTMPSSWSAMSWKTPPRWHRRFRRVSTPERIARSDNRVSTEKSSCSHCFVSRSWTRSWTRSSWVWAAAEPRGSWVDFRKSCSRKPSLLMTSNRSGGSFLFRVGKR
mmetsp:Transcript_2220/g.5944  ORF Transcript_2220/g.5944 Transcript_2220/m.5944 type:complete len:216 (+) Transcript_2220:1171-1818(+)